MRGLKSTHNTFRGKQRGTSPKGVKLSKSFTLRKTQAPPITYSTIPQRTNNKRKLGN